MNEGIKTFIAGAALLKNRRVKIKAGTLLDPPEVEYAGAGEDFIGVTEYSVNSGELVAVRLKNHPGTLDIECLVDVAIARGASLYGAANGLVSDTVSGTAQVVALEVGDDNAIIECVVL